MKRRGIICLVLAVVLMCTPTFSWAQRSDDNSDAKDTFTNEDSIYVNELDCKGTMSNSKILEVAGTLSEDFDDGKLDVVFAIDSTGSMGDEISSIVSNISDFARKCHKS